MKKLVISSFLQAEAILEHFYGLIGAQMIEIPYYLS